MTNQDWKSAAPPRWESVAAPRRRVSLAAAHRGEGHGDGRYLAAYRRLLARHKRLIRRIGMGAGILAGLLFAGCLGLWWRLESGPIQLDVVTPWLASAIEENFGSQHHVEVGGTQIERTENGGAAVRIRDIVVRDSDGSVVARAPKAEVRVSGMSLLSGHMRAESFNLVGAQMAVRIEHDGDVTVFAGADKHPIATATVPVAASALIAGREKSNRASSSVVTPPDVVTGAPATVPSNEMPRPQPHQTGDVLEALLSWIDGIGESGLDGHDLRELGLKDGSLTVDDERTGKRWTFEDITLTMARPRGGGVEVTVGSDNPARSWGLSAAIKPMHGGFHSIELEARHVSASDLLLASRVGDGAIETDLPLSASLRGEIGPDGVPRSLTGRIVADAGFIGDGNGADGSLNIDRAEIKVDWDAASRSLSMPFQILSGGNRITLMANVDAPLQPSGAWSFKIGGGTVVLTAPGAASDPLILNRIALIGHFDPLKRQIAIQHADLGNTEISVAMSGSADYSSGDLHLTAGLAATRMSADALKRLWPAFVSPKVRDWFLEHLVSGTLDRLVVAVNAPFNTLKASGPLLPDDGLAIDAQATNCVIRPVQGLPALRDADLNVHVAGRYVSITLNKATADLPSGRKLVMSVGQFEVPDTGPREPPARIHFKLDGTVPAAVELLSLDRLRDSAGGVPFDAATSHGTMSAQVALGLPLKPDLPPGSSTYAVTVDATNFAADDMVMGQKVEAAALKVIANNQGFELKGDVKIGGTPATLDYRKARDDSDAEVHIDGMLDEAARRNLSLDPADSISGSIPIRLNGRVDAMSQHSGRFTVEADLTPAQIENFLPGWVKSAGKPARATFTLTTDPQSIRIDDLLIEGAGGGVKGAVEMDGSGQLRSASFPSYGFSDGDRASLKVDRAPDGALRVVMRGDVYDGRSFVKALTGGPNGQPSGKAPDIDLDMKLGAIVGFNGEALRSLDLKMTRRAGEIRSFALNAKIGRDANLTGELRNAGPNGRPVIALTSGDGGALFRFTDVYSRMAGGQMVIAMDAPSASNPTQQGALTVHNFVIHGEEQLQRAVATNDGQVQSNDMVFSSMRVEFTRTPGRVVLREGVVRGPLLGATIDGMVDYAGDEVHLRGTLVPLYGPNNLLGQLPIVGLFLGGEKEGLVGITYEVVGQPGNPVLRINPISALAPGLLRKVFEYPAANGGYQGNAGYPANAAGANDNR
jgi:hypothetical protein